MDIIINANATSLPEGARELSSQGSPLLNLLAYLGYDSTNPPLAQLLSQHHQLDGDWLVLSPVHWQATHNNAVIAAIGEQLELNEQQLKQHFHSFSEHLMHEGIGLYYHDACTWLLSTNHKSLLKAKPVYSLLNKPLMLELAQIDETMHWPKFLTESQMFFASRPNTSLVNGIWVWGGGALGERKNIKICADETFFPFAQQCSTEVSLYNSSLSLKEYDVLLLNDLSSLNSTHQEQLEKITIRWYWNNIGYEFSSVSWFTRLWRKLIYAD